MCEKAFANLAYSGGLPALCEGRAEIGHGTQSPCHQFELPFPSWSRPCQEVDPELVQYLHQGSQSGVCFQQKCNCKVQKWICCLEKEEERKQRRQKGRKKERKEERKEDRQQGTKDENRN